LQGFAPNKGCRYPARRGLNPSHQTLLLGSSAEIGQLGAPQTPGDGVRTWLAAGQTTTQIAEGLNREGFHSPSGRLDRFTPRRVGR